MNALELKSRASPDLARVFLWGSLVFFLLLLGAQLGLWANRREPLFQVDSSHLASAELPPWAPPLWKSEIERALRGGGSFSIFDGQALLSTRAKIEALPFVERVDLVSRRFPRAIAAKIDLRRPVALVRRAGRHYAIDARGILLPGKPEDAKGGFAFPLPVLMGRPFAKQPTSNGEAWLEEDIAEGIAAALEVEAFLDLYPGFRVTSIDLSNLGNRVSPLDAEITLQTDSGTRILWGRSARKKPYGELTPQAKIGNLQRALEEFPALKNVRELDLRFDRPAIHLRQG